jgi:hypothetical protein
MPETSEPPVLTLPFFEPGSELALYIAGSSYFYIIGSLMKHVIQNLTNEIILIDQKK